MGILDSVGKNTDTSHYLAHELRSIVQFMVRADEVAFHHKGLATDFVPHWIKDSSWVHDWKGGTSLALGETLSLPTVDI